MPPTDGPGMSGAPFDLLVDYGLRENTQGKCYFKGQVSLFAVNDPLTMMTMSRSQKVFPLTLGFFGTLPYVSARIVAIDTRIFC